MNVCPSVNAGFYFKCIQCGRCCSNEQEGYIFIYWEDIQKICATLNISEMEFAKTYLAITSCDYRIWSDKFEDTGNKKEMETLILKTELLQDCIFLFEENGKKLCKVYKSRPVQCELFPFWNMLITNEKMFRIIEKDCLGINKTGNKENFYSKDKIISISLKEKQIEHNFYLEMKKNNFKIKDVYPFLKNIDELPHID